MYTGFSKLAYASSIAVDSSYSDLTRNLEARVLPLGADRHEARSVQRDGSNPSFVAASWAASVSDAARALSSLVVIHDNGGTASSPKKIKDAARELLRLLGEDRP